MASNSILLSKVLLLILFIISQHSLGLYFYPGMYRHFISCNDQVLQSSENDQPNQYHNQILFVMGFALKSPISKIYLFETHIFVISTLSWSN